MRKFGAYGDKLANVFHADAAPTLITRVVRRSMIAVTEIVCRRPNNGLTDPIPREDALLLQLQLADCHDYELWIDGCSVPTKPLAAGATCIYDLRANPVANSISPFRSLNIYLPRHALDVVADIENLRRTNAVDRGAGEAVEDPIIRALGLALEPAIRHPELANPLYVDHVAVALAAHALRTYCGGAPRPEVTETRLTSSQLRRVEELIDSDLQGEFSIIRLAAACGLTVSRFALAFRDTTGMMPSEWLMRRRLDKAQDMLRRTSVRLAVIACACGYSSEAHFIEAFTAHFGVDPKTCRSR